MTSTAVLSAQSIGTGANKGNDLTFSASAMKVTIQTGTTAFCVAGELTNGSASYDQANRPTIRYATSPFSYAYDAAPPNLRTTARYLEMIPKQSAGGIAARNSDLEVVKGSYIYVWVDVPGVAVAQTLTINVVELP